VIRYLLGFLLFVASTFRLQAQSGDQGFVPINEIPVSEQLPAAPLLVAAYAIVWLVPMMYLWFIWRRLNKVEREVSDLERRTPGGSRV
jgi:CcmD family protein